MDIEKIKSALNTLPGCHYDITSQSESEVCVKIINTKVKILTLKISPFGFVIPINLFFL